MAGSPCTDAITPTDGACESDHVGGTPGQGLLHHDWLQNDIPGGHMASALEL